MTLRRILILAPHPDDEIVACGLAAREARAAGGRLAVLYLTTGVPAGRNYPVRVARRRAEAERAAALLGLEPAGSLDIPSRELVGHLDPAARALAAAIAAFRPDALWVPAFEGAHQDHDCANALAACGRGSLPVWEFAAYNFAGGRVNRNRFHDTRGGVIERRAGRDEIGWKRSALALYRSERGNLRHVGLVDEAYRPLPGHDYAAPPHEGRLFRERFHWVPFRHPRIDFTPSAEIYRTLGAWTAGAGALDIAAGTAGDCGGQGGEWR